MDFTLGDWLLEAVKLSKNADADKYGYSGYQIGFDARSQFSLSNGEWRQSAVIFGFDDSSSMYADN